jgi:hypothetical protein
MRLHSVHQDGGSASTPIVKARPFKLPSPTNRMGVAQKRSTCSQAAELARSPSITLRKRQTTVVFR